MNSQTTTTIAALAAAGVLSLASGSGRAADAPEGKRLFTERCAICHSAEPADGGGAQGPSLIGVFGRAAASTSFPYSEALKDSHLKWDEATLDRFLNAPATMVPGTSMVVAVPKNNERADIIAYFKSVAAVKTVAVAAVSPATSSSADWHLDAPGKLHRIDLAKLPPPFATPSSNNRTSVKSRPAGAQLKVPAGFHVEPFANGFEGPRRMLLAANGDVLLTETYGGRVTILHPSAARDKAERAESFAAGLKQPFGLAFYPNAQNPEWLYVGETDEVVRFRYHTGDTHANAAGEVVVRNIPSGGHFTRDVAFSPDGKQLFVSVGSASNVAESMKKKSVAEAQAWDKAHGFGAAWGNETNRADVLVFDAAHPGEPSVYASGIRNCVSLTVQPANGALWCTTNERDALGDDLVPDYSTRVHAGDFYGWPWYYMGSHEDPRLKGERPDLAGKVHLPDVPYQAHSASLSMTFYQTSHGKSAFPEEYAGDAIVTLHGSWNRSLRTGYKLVRVHMKNGEPTGDYEDFLTGFVIDNDSVWGRPVATVQLDDGSLLMSEDGNNFIYRISFER
jgi:hypothetical protein